MRSFTVDHLTRLAVMMLEAANVPGPIARRVAEHLVLANLVGHDSHGVLRIPQYVDWIKQGIIRPDGVQSIERETETLVVVNGGWNFGMVVAQKTMELIIGKARSTGVAMASVHECAHIGRVGEYAEMAAEYEMVSILCVNTHGGGKLTVPWGGKERRLSANPICIGAPQRGGDPIVLDIATCAIAEGKVKNLMFSGKPLPAGCVIDGHGNPTTNPADLYGPPIGAILPFGGHKGFGLSVMVDILAGALSGAGCSSPQTDRVANSFLAIVIDPSRCRDLGGFYADVDGFVDYIRSCPLAPGYDQILLPGEIEAKTREARKREGIPLPQKVFAQLQRTALELGVSASDHQLTAL